MRNSPLTLLILLFFMGCMSGSQDATYMPEGLDRRETTRYQQYLIQGKKLYKEHCAQCHQETGTGLAQLYPPLAGSDYLLKDIARAACILRNGQEGEIRVNGVTYNTQMPGVPTLTAIEIAEILTFIANSWGNETGFIPVQEVQRYLTACDQGTK